MSQAIAQLRAGTSPLLPIYPSSFEDVVRFARIGIMAGMVKPQKRGWGDDAQEEDASAVEARATMIILQGMELGIPPMQALQLLAMINGRIVAHSEAVPGQLLSKGFKIAKKWRGTEYGDDWGVTCILTRPTGEVFEGDFSVAKARKAGLWSPDPKVKKRGKNNSFYEADNDSAWHRYPDRMLWARALGFAAKDGAADVLRGLAIREEVEDMIRSDAARDITPTRQISALEIPDDIPDSTSSKTAGNTKPDLAIEPDNEPDELADPAGLLAKLADDIALCSSIEELSEIEDQYADLIPRLPKSDQAKAKKLISDAKE
jgi:hypothetical protein